MKRLPALLVFFMLSLTASAASVAEIRAGALKAAKPCVIITHVDSTAL